MKSLRDLQPENWSIALNKNQYEAQINRKNPSAILFMIDQSGSMGFTKCKYKGEEMTYAQIVAEMINGMMSELISRCTKAEGVRDYFEVCVLGYGGYSSIEANILWEGNLLGKQWVNLSELKSNARYEKRTVVKTIRGKSKVSEIEVPYWFQPVAQMQTPMGNAFKKVHTLLNDWILTDDHANSYPPVVINITDGVPTDCKDLELIEAANKVQALNTKDGHVLVLNCHISSEGQPLLFPLKSEELPDSKYASVLYEMSSVMPEVFGRDISNIRNDADVLPGYRGMGYNASMDALFNLIDIGTSGSTQHITRG